MVVFGHRLSGRYIPPRYLVRCLPAEVGLPPCCSQNEYGAGSKTPGLRQALLFQWLAVITSWISPRIAEEHRVVLGLSFLEHPPPTGRHEPPGLVQCNTPELPRRHCTSAVCCPPPLAAGQGVHLWGDRGLLWLASYEPLIQSPNQVATSPDHLLSQRHQDSDSERAQLAMKQQDVASTPIGLSKLP